MYLLEEERRRHPSLSVTCRHEIDMAGSIQVDLTGFDDDIIRYSEEDSRAHWRHTVVELDGAAIYRMSVVGDRGRAYNVAGLLATKLAEGVDRLWPPRWMFRVGVRSKRRRAEPWMRPKARPRFMSRFHV
jgi:hypothetical protein